MEGMEPWFEIGPLGVWEGQISHLETALDLVKKMDEVIRLEGPVEKWTDLGMKPIWKVVVKHPAVVPRVRKELMSSWNLYSGDIPFANRILLDGDFGIHATASAEIISRSDFCDLYVRCQWQDISSTEPFSVPCFRIVFGVYFCSGKKFVDRMPAFIGNKTKNETRKKIR